MEWGPSAPCTATLSSVPSPHPPGHLARSSPPEPLWLPRLHTVMMLNPGLKEATSMSTKLGVHRGAAWRVRSCLLRHTGQLGPLCPKHWFPPPLRPAFLSSCNLLNLGRLYLHPGYSLKTNPKTSERSRISQAVLSPGSPRWSQSQGFRPPAVSTGT